MFKLSNPIHICISFIILYSVAVFQCSTGSMLKCFSVAELQCCSVEVLPCCSVAVLSCRSVAVCPVNVAVLQFVH